MVATPSHSDDNAPALSDVLAAQPDSVKARYDARHPQQTLEFFGAGRRNPGH